MPILAGRCCTVGYPLLYSNHWVWAGSPSGFQDCARKERVLEKKARFDGNAFYAALDGERQARQCTWRRVAQESGVSASTLTRIAQGKHPDVDSLAALSAWSGLDV